MLAVFLSYITMLFMIYCIIDGMPYLSSVGTYKLLNSDGWKDAVEAMSIPGELLHELNCTVICLIEDKIRNLDLGERFTDTITDLCACITYTVTYICLSKIYLLAGYLFFGSTYSALNDIITSLVSGEGASIIDLFKVLYVTAFQSGGFWGGLFSLLLMVLFNILYFSILFGFLVEKHSESIRESRILNILKNNPIVVGLILLVVFTLSCFVRFVNTPSVLDMVIYFLNKFNVIDLIIPNVVQAATVILPATAATAVVKVYSAYRGTAEMKVFKSHRFTDKDD